MHKRSFVLLRPWCCPHHSLLIKRSLTLTSATWDHSTNLAAESFDSTAVVNLLATASATSEIRGGELPWRGAKKKLERERNWELQIIEGRKFVWAR